MTEQEADRIAGMVLKLVTEVGRRYHAMPVRLSEPTGVTYAPAMSQFVEKRSGER